MKVLKQLLGRTKSRTWHVVRFCLAYLLGSMLLLTPIGLLFHDAIPMFLVGLPIGAVVMLVVLISPWSIYNMPRRDAS